MRYLIILIFIHSVSEAKSVDFNNKTNILYTSARIETLALVKINPSAYSKNLNIIFIHPPKVAGTNVVHAIDGLKDIASHRFAVPRKNSISPNLIISGWIGGLETIKKDCKKIINCSKYTFISGHFPYGADKYLPKKYQYITIIRNPIEREISSVNFDYQRGYIKNYTEAINYLENIMIDNPQTRLIAGEDYMHNICDKNTLKKAKENLLKHFLLVGVTEDVKTFTQVLISILGNEPIAIGRSQVTHDKIIRTIPKNLYKTLESKHKYDIELYRFAKKHWKEWKKKNIISTIKIPKTKNIIAIMPNYAHTHQIVYMNNGQIKKYNSSFGKKELIKIEQKHHGMTTQKQ